METPKTKVLLIEDNLVNARMVQAMLATSSTGSFDVQHAITLLATLDLLAKFKFDIAILDLTLPDSQGLETFLTVSRHAPNLPIIVVTGVDDESVALNAVRQGAQDYLVKGELKQEKLIRALNYALARTQKPAVASVQPPPNAPVIGLIGAKGGVGTTTIACHWALELKKQTGDPVLLVDLDLSSAISSFLMRADSRSTMQDAALNLHRLDAALWKGMVFHGQDGVDLLQAPGAAGPSDILPAERVRHVLRFAQTQYRGVIVDLGRLTDSSFTILEEVSDLFLITTPELTALHEASRLIRKMREMHISQERLKLVLNRHAKGKSISADDIERALGYPCYASIGDSSDELEEAYASGRLLDDKTKLHKEIARLVGRWRGVEEKQQTASGFGFLKRLRA